MNVNGSDPKAKTPKVGSRWVWEIDKPHARQMIEVVDVKWNGDEWWIYGKELPTTRDEEWYRESGVSSQDRVHPNELSRFMEVCTPVGGTAHSLLEERVVGR